MCFIAALTYLHIFTTTIQKTLHSPGVANSHWKEDNLRKENVLEICKNTSE